MSRNDHDDDRPRWREADEEEDAPRDWEEVEPEDEKENRGGMLTGTAPVARVVFAIILVVVVVGTFLALKDGLSRWFGG